MVRLPNANRWGTVLMPFPVPISQLSYKLTLHDANRTVVFSCLYRLHEGGAGNFYTKNQERRP
jgi:hypothetical protein|nr:MAG TPA: hypothetical protein [Caudoviricetes sp.]